MEIYYNQKKQIVQQVEQLSITSSMAWFRRFAYFSANVGVFLPFISYQEHIPLFKQTIINQQLSFLDQEYADKLAIHWHAPNSLATMCLRDRPAILATFHTGSYRILPYLLAREGVPFALLIAGDVLEKQGRVFKQWYGRIQGDNPQPFQLINASERTSALQMLRALREGKSLLAYLDGNTGTAATNVSEKLYRIDFLAASMEVRKGLAWLAQKACVPLHNLVCLREQDGGIRIQLTRSFQPGPGMQHTDFAKVAIQLMYKDLADCICVQPWQWENWFYLQQYLPV